MWALTGRKFSAMKTAVLSSSYDSASSRAQAPQAGAALKSSRMGCCFSLATSNDSSTSLLQFTGMSFSPSPTKDEPQRQKLQSIASRNQGAQTSTANDSDNGLLEGDSCHCRTICKGRSPRGGMCERLKQAVLKTAVLERVPGVRIPLPPPASLNCRDIPPHSSDDNARAKPRP